MINKEKSGKKRESIKEENPQIIDPIFDVFNFIIPVILIKYLCIILNFDNIFY